MKSAPLPLLLLLLLLLPLTVSTSAQAFRISAHEWITHQAVAEFNTCYPGALSAQDETILSWSNVEEDANLIRKWGKYSHFYNPDQPLDLGFRVDSSVRIADLEEILTTETAKGEQGTFTILVGIGHAAHHIQDMASPPHVVPVMHDLDDQFEKHELDGHSVPFSSQPLVADCAAFTASADPGSFHELLTQTARATLDSYNSSHFTALREGQPQAFNESAFWLRSGSSAFGTYGFLGNSFGLTQFLLSGTTYKIAPEAYTSIWGRQLALAVHATKRALYRALMMRAI